MKPVSFFLALCWLTSFVRGAEQTSIIAGKWITLRGAEYVFQKDTMVCQSMPVGASEARKQWVGLVRLKQIEKTQDGYVALQAYRKPPNMLKPKWVRANLHFLSEDVFTLSYKGLNGREYVSRLIKERVYLDYQAGLEAYSKEDYSDAFKCFERVANSNAVEGLHASGSMYYQGVGTAKDVNRAVQLFTSAADLGHSPAQANLGLMYHNGDGVEKSIEKAIFYYTSAAKQGNLQSSFNLGQIHRKGDGVEIDLKKAARYYKSAAEGGYVKAMNEYGLLFAQGQGVEQDYVEAYAWISYAAEQGDTEAAKNLVKLKLILSDKGLDAEQRTRQIKKLIAPIGKPPALLGRLSKFYLYRGFPRY